MFDLRRTVRVAATVGLALVTLAADHLTSQGRRNGRSPSTTILDGREVVEGEVIVRYRSESGVVERQRAEFQVDSEETESVGRRGARRMRSRRLATREMLQALRSNPDVEYAEPNYIIRLALTPNDPSFGNLWGLFNSGQNISGSTGTAGADIDMPLTWQYALGSRSNVVGVIDTGIDYNHPDLAANIWTAPRAFSVTVSGVTINCAAGTHGFNAITNTCNPMDDHSHGTHVAGTIGAVGNNGVGVSGVNWVASMMGLKFLSASGSGTTANAIKAIEFAIQAKRILGADANVRILSNSWGGGGYSTALGNQIAAADTADMLFVAAAGNDGLNNDIYAHYPSSYTNANVLSVASTTNRDQRSSFSNYGVVSVDIGAPGSSILSTTPGNTYAYYSGTSMATPHVAGVAALVLGACPVSTAALKAALLYGADAIPAMAGITTTGGRLNAYGALVTCQPASLNVTTPTVIPGELMQMSVQNSFPRTNDWIGMYRAGATDGNFTDWFYLNGQKTLPVSASVSSNLQYPANAVAGTYQLRLFTNGYTRLATGSVTIMLPPALSISDVSVTEGSSGTRLATFTVSLDRTWARNVSVAYTTVDGSATAGSDYVATSGTLTIPAYSNSGTISVTVNGDTTAEITETFLLNLSSPVNASIVDGQGVGTIVTDEVPPTPSMMPTAVSFAPGTQAGVTVSNASGHARDWIGIYSTLTAANADFVDWVYLNGQKTPPSIGLPNTTVQFAAPLNPGVYYLRLFGMNYTVQGFSEIHVGVTPALTVSDVSVQEGNSGWQNAGFYITLAPPTSRTVTVSYSTADITATAGSDYTAASGTLTFPPGSSTAFVGIVVFGDTAVEPNETFAFNLSNATNASITKQGIATIVTDEAPSASITANAGLVFPGAPISAVIANGAGAARDWIGVYASSTAGDGGFIDWVYLNGQKSLPSAGLSNTTVQFAAPSVAGTYYLRLFTTGYTRLATSGQVTVAAMPVLTINDVTVTEGNSGTTTATFTVTLNSSSAQTIAVDFTTANITAASGSDYAAASGVITFAPSVTTQTISVTVNGDTAIEATETFAVNLSNATNASIGDSQGLGTITTDDLPPSPSLTVGASPVAPGALISAVIDNGPGAARDWIGLFNPADPDGIFIDWWYLNGSKTAPATGSSSVTVQVPAPLATGNYQLRLFTMNYAKLATANVVVSPLPVLTINDVSVAEGNSGTTTAVFTVSLNAASPLDVAVTFATVNGTATSGSDYVAASGILNFSPGVTTRTVSVTVNGDVVIEGQESFYVNLSLPHNASLGDAQGVGAIATDDAAPQPTLTVLSASVVRGGMIDVVVANGPGLARDWIGVFAPGADNYSFQEWAYLNGQKTAPVSGPANVTLQIPAPQTAGTYELRLFTNGYNRLATSGTVLVVP